MRTTRYAVLAVALLLTGCAGTMSSTPSGGATATAELRDANNQVVGQANLIDTDRCPVHMLTGEYDAPTMPFSVQASNEIPGATFAPMPGLGHFPMSEDPERFIEHLLPILASIAEHADHES